MIFNSRRRVARLEDEIAQLRRDKTELITAIRLTQEYTMLPALPGWTWYDTLTRHDPQLLETMLRSPAYESVRRIE